MSIHPTLRGVDTLKGERSVFTRVERLAILTKEGRFDEAKALSVTGLPKVRTRFKVAGVKKVAAPKAEGAAAAGTVPAAAGAAPAKGAAAAKGAAPAGAKAAGDKKPAEKGDKKK